MATTPLHRLLRQRDGGILIVVAFALIPLVGALGVGVDGARGYLVKAKLSQSLDIAALAAAQTMHQPENIQAELDRFFKANFPSQYMSATVDGPTYTHDAQDNVLEVNATATIRTSFIGILGMDTIRVSASTEVTNRKKTIDVVLAIDMSGSMGWDIAGNSNPDEEDKRIYAAREAAQELVDVLFGENTTPELLQIGVVPWNGKVNVMQNGVAYAPGLSTSEAVATFDSTPTYANPGGGPQSVVYFANNSVVPLMSSPPSTWQGCVYARYQDDGAEEGDADILYGSIDTGNGDWRAWEPVGPEGEPVPGSARCSTAPAGWDCRPCLDHGITPLGNDKQGILDAIDELTTPVGPTNITQGLAWAWRVLMPTSPYTEAVPDENAVGTRAQVIVLLTDGQNDGAYGDGYKGVFGDDPATSRPPMDARLRLLSTNVKNDGAIIYSIQFANGDGDLATLLKDVATSPAAPHYHYAPDAATLREIFKTIANDISALRISR